MSTLKSKPRRGAGGPRTAHGKSKSSKNSQKHLIFIDRVLPEEENAASSLYDEIRAEFDLEGPMELRIGRDLVQNELQAGRIERFAVQEWIKAATLAPADFDNDSRAYTHRFTIPKEHQSEPGYFTRLRPGYCAIYLAHLKRTIEQRGLRSDEDLEFIRLIYGNQMTALAETIVAFYKMLEPGADVDKTDGNVKARKIDDGQARILEIIQSEIMAQEMRRELEKVRESFEPASDSVVLPPPDVDDRIERYRTANTRKMDRSLAILETIRRLKKEA
jgi:hypothetical protein